MGRSEPEGEKEGELARMATKVIAAGRREGRQANNWRTFNEKGINQVKTGLFIPSLREMEHPGNYERVGIFILESRRDLGRFYEMAPVRILPHLSNAIPQPLMSMRVTNTVFVTGNTFSPPEAALLLVLSKRLGTRGPVMGELSKAKDLVESHCWHRTCQRDGNVSFLFITTKYKCLRYGLPTCNKCSVFKQNEDVEG